MLLHAGLDWSGPRSLDSSRSGLYVPCLAAVSDAEELSDRFRALRHRFEFGAADEFHGHEITEEIQTAVLGAAVELEFRVAASLYERTTLPPAAELPARAALAVCERFFSKHSLVRLWCDQDIEGKERQKRFITDVKRIHRTFHQGTHLKVRFKASEDSDLIQLADVTAFGLSRLARGMVKDLALREWLEAIWSDPLNLIEGPTVWRG